MSGKHYRFFFLLSLLGAAALNAPATLVVTGNNGFTQNWFFHNTNAKYTEMLASHGYFKDFNKDGLPDYLVYLQDPVKLDTRLFFLDTKATGGEKFYPTNATAYRDFAALPGSLVPHTLCTPRAPKMDSPDLVLVYSDQAKATAPATGFKSTFKTFTFNRLNQADKYLTPNKAWAQPLDFEADWVVQWLDFSYNADDYPDYLIYNCDLPNTTNAAKRNFHIMCCDGLTGAIIWSVVLSQSADDNNMMQTGSGAVLPYSHLMVEALPMIQAPQAGTADFDKDGRPELLLYYTYKKMDITAAKISTMGKINLLDSKGHFCPGYSGVWTAIRQDDDYMATWPGVMPMADFDNDGYRDLLLYNITTPKFPTQVIEGYSLKKRASLFKSNATDFGPTAEDSNHFRVINAYRFSNYAPLDINGDGYTDLILNRGQGPLGSVLSPARVGVFSGMGSKPGPGRRIWSAMSSQPAYDQVLMSTNDFNLDDIVDVLLAKNPTTPARPTWKLSTTAITKTGLTAGKQLTYTSTANSQIDLAKQNFMAMAFFFTGFGDVDNDGQRDTAGSLIWSVTNETSGNGGMSASGASILIFDSTSGTTTPLSVTASFDFKVTFEDKMMLVPMLQRALAANGYTYVDNNKNGLLDDVVIWNPGVVYSLSLKPKGAYPAAAQATTPTPANGAHYGLTLPLSWTPSAGAQSYAVYLGKTSAAVTAATPASPEYCGTIDGRTVYRPTVTLSPSLNYYWRVDAINAWGKVTKGAVWSYYTIR